MCEKPSGRKFLGLPLITYNIHSEKKQCGKCITKKKKTEKMNTGGLIMEE